MHTESLHNYLKHREYNLRELVGTVDLMVTVLNLIYNDRP